MMHTVRIGTMMSPSVGIWQRLTHRVHEPMVHRDHDPPPRQHADALDAGHVGDLPGPGARGVDRHPGLHVELLPGGAAAQPRAGHVVALAVDGDHLVVGQDPRAPLLGAARHRPDCLPHVDVGVGHAEGAGDPRIQPRLLAQCLRRIDLLAVDAGIAASLGEAVGVGGVVERGGDEQAAGVLDAVGGDVAAGCGSRAMHSSAAWGSLTT